MPRAIERDHLPDRPLGLSERTLRATIAALAAAGAAVAGYLSYVGLFDTSIACPTGGCETVQSSSYAEVGGVPIAVAGFLAWLAVLAATLARGIAAVAAAAFVALAGALVSLYLLYVQAFVLEAFCIWCVVSDVLMLVVAALATVRLLRSAG